MRSVLLIPLLLMGFLSLNAQFAERMSGEVIVKVNEEDIEHYVEELNANFTFLNVDIAEKLSQHLDLYLLTFDESQTDGNALELFKEFPACHYAQWNHNNIEYRAEPDDPSYIAQWSLKNIEAAQAWDITTGGMTKDSHEIVIAVVDESFLITHDDLQAAYWKNKHEIPGNNIDDDNNGYKDDYDGWNAIEDTGRIYLYRRTNHGTMVSGMAGASTNNTTDMASVNWNVKILPVIAGGSTNEVVIIKSYDYVLSQRLKYNQSNGDSGAYIVVANSSFGVNNGKPQDYPAWCEMYNTMGQAGIVSVGAGPNLQIDIDDQGDIPCNCTSEYFIGVTRTNSNDELDGGGYGATSIDLGAPGVGVLSLSASNSVTVGTGTSYAAPLVSGAIALMYSAIPEDSMRSYASRPDELALKVRSLLFNHGTKNIASLAGRSTTGGMLNLFRAVTAADKFDDVAIGEDEGIVISNNLLVYPNPNLGLLNVNLQSEGIGDFQLSLYSISGKLLIETEIKAMETRQLDLQNLDAGMYFLSLSLKGELVETIKVVKE